jgi:hypothetical protein
MSIPWAEPIKITVPGRGDWFACRQCIAERGLRWEEDGNGSLNPLTVIDGEPFPAYRDIGEAIVHIASEHQRV